MAHPLADSLEALAKRLTEVAAGLRSGNLSLETDAPQRMGLMSACVDVANTVSRPADKLLLWLPHFTHITAIRLFIKWKAFAHIPSGNSISYADLAAKLGADVSLISKTPSLMLPLLLSSGTQLTG